MEPNETALQSMLQELSRQGQLHSSGRFQVDLERSLKKLTRFNEKSPDYFALHLVSAVVALGAEVLEIELASHLWRFEFDGPTLSSEQLQHIFPSLAMASPGPVGFALRELALALCNCHGLGDCHIFLSTGSALLELTPQFLRLSPTSEATQRTRVEVHFPQRKSWWSAWLRGPGPVLSLERVRRAARFSGLKLMTAGVAPAEELQIGPVAVCVRVRGRTPLPAIALDAELLEELEEDSDFSLLIGLSPSPTQGSPKLSPALRSEVVTLVNWGLAFEVTARWCLDGSWVILAHNGLRRDLLGRHVVRDETLQRALERAQEHLVGMLRRTLTSNREEAPYVIDHVLYWLQLLRLRNRPRMPAPFEGLPLGRPGGWAGHPVLERLKETARRQGFLHYDPQRCGPTYLQLLRQAAPTLIAQTNYRPWQPPPGEWLLGVATPWGEIHYSAAWPGKAAVIQSDTLPVRVPTWLLSGLTIVLRGPHPQIDDWRSALLLLKRVFGNLLEADPKGFLGSAPALRLALWLTFELPRIFRSSSRRLRSGLPLAMHLRMFPRGSRPLAAVLKGSALPFWLEGEGSGDCSPAVLLSEAERRVLSDFRPGWLCPLGSPPTSWHELVHQAVHQLKADRGCLLALSGPEPSILAAHRMLDFQRGLRYVDIVTGEPLLSHICARIHLGHCWSSTAGVPFDGQIRPVTFYLVAPHCAGQALYLERRAHAGAFAEADEETLKALATANSSLRTGPAPSSP